MSQNDEKMQVPNGIDGSHGDDKQDLSRRPTLTVTPEMFEKMYLGPQTKVAGNLRQTVGNPAPL